jgi:membrane-associated phospholipid phosphatase
VVGVIALLVSMGISGEETIPDWEVDVFRLVNDLPGALYPVVWPLMQFGTFISIPIATVIALAFRRVRLAIAIAVSGVGVYYLAKVVKDVVYRLRPGALLEDVHLRGIGTLGLGYPSGHAAVSAALAVAISPYVSRVWRRVLVGLAVFVSVARVYVGGHLPLDSVGGAGLGVALASAMHLLLGVPASPATTSAETATRSDRV